MFVHVVYFHLSHLKSHLVCCLVSSQHQCSHPLLALYHLSMELLLKKTKTLSENTPRILFPVLLYTCICKNYNKPILGLKSPPLFLCVMLIIASI